MKSCAHRMIEQLLTLAVTHGRKRGAENHRLALIYIDLAVELHRAQLPMQGIGTQEKKHGNRNLDPGDVRLRAGGD